VVLGLGIVGLLGLLAIALYSRLAGLQAEVQNGWSEIEAHLTRRHELVGSLLNAVRGVLELEPETLNEVMDGREGARG
jgi:LemA protein